MESFDKDKVGLFPVHLHVDARGLVWVNLENTKESSVPWADDFSGADKQPRLNAYNMEEYVFDHVWGMKGDYNWKTLVDNYNEVRLCRTFESNAHSFGGQPQSTLRSV